jgi:hypothetical protein
MTGLEITIMVLIYLWVLSYVTSLFVTYTFGFKKEEYFPMLIRGFKNSSLRSFWKWLYLGIMYFIGIIVLGWYKSGEIPSNWTKRVIKFILFTPENNTKGNKNVRSNNRKEKRSKV